MGKSYFFLDFALYAQIIGWADAHSVQTVHPTHWGILLKMRQNKKNIEDQNFLIFYTRPFAKSLEVPKLPKFLVLGQF